jgi:hypothetical protein
MLVEAEALGINLEQFFLHVPVLAFAAHALAKTLEFSLPPRASWMSEPSLTVGLMPRWYISLAHCPLTNESEPSLTVGLMPRRT